MLRRVLRGLLFLLGAGLWSAGLAAAQDWPEIPKSEWALADDPANPGASAIILYREEIIDDNNGFSKNYYRIKILKDEGKKYGDRSIRFFKGRTRIEDIDARTVQPDGRVSDFDGKVFTKEVVKARGVNYLAKTFTLPDVQPGSIIEYRYTERWEQVPQSLLQSPGIGFYLSQLSPTLTARWLVQDELFTKRAHFSFRPIPSFGLSWTWFELPGDAKPMNHQGLIEFDAQDIPAFQAEDYIPPEDMLKGRVEFFYIFTSVPKNTQGTDWFWTEEGNKHAKNVESFIGKDKSVARELESVTQTSDLPEVKLRKIYDRVQKIRNLSFESQKTEQEERREKLSDNNTAGDVVKHGYGWGYQINDLFVAMARAAGFDAAIVEVAQRDTRFFAPQLLDWSQLTANLTVVKVNGKDQFFDPATPFCPYGLVPWSEDTTAGFRLDKDGATSIKIPPSPSSDTVISRKATLQLGDDAGVTGQFEVSFTGQDALQRRFENRERDDTGRRKALEDELKGWFPSGAAITLNSVTGWDNSYEPLKIDFTVTVEGSARIGLSRLLYPAMPFPGEVKYSFQSAQRNLPVYITYPYEQSDEFTLQLPKSMRVENLPAPRNVKNVFGEYELTLEDHGGSVLIRRHFMLQQGLIPPQYYSELRAFLTSVRQGDENQFVLQSTSLGQAGAGR